ncbi:expressed protein [Chlorella variabilis]|uniref:Expressed protein n=1 Tax=Chlorella variabilis TaxID=554065 RepID=E1ZBS5_CHLVA|nr:expressed protein [Chlorella variabilis]EFN56691.1 expressed protein [Chlorella variabilis]|eukprot:XP_005848793.1 expressed protein [Chlorella variabilis]
MQTVSLSHSRLNTHFTTTARRVTSPCIAPARPQQRRGGRAAQQLLRARAEVQQAPAAAPAAQQSVDSDGEERVPPGCARYTVELPKPLGLVLEEGKSGRGVYVAEVVPDSNAARLAPQIGVGDELVATTGMTYTTAQEYQGNTVRGGETYVRLNVRNNTFSTVMAAIGSVKPPRLVTLEFQRCD